jgi:hypothetical protein
MRADGGARVVAASGASPIARGRQRADRGRRGGPDGGAPLPAVGGGEAS